MAENGLSLPSLSSPLGLFTMVRCEKCSHLSILSLDSIFSGLISTKNKTQSLESIFTTNPSEKYMNRKNKSALNDLLKRISELQHSTGAVSSDVNFLHNFIADDVMKHLVIAHDALSPNQEKSPPRSGSGGLISLQNLMPDVHALAATGNPAAGDLESILTDPHFLSLLDAYDVILQKQFESPPYFQSSSDITDSASSNINEKSNVSTIRVFSVIKNSTAPLGITLRVDDDGNLKIQRILSGGLIDKTGLCRVSDTVLEVNGYPCKRDQVMFPDGTQQKIQQYLKDYNGDLRFKIVKSPEEKKVLSQKFVKALYDYNPAKDSLLSNPDLGLSFKCGDILEVVDRQSDPSWWQVRHYGNTQSLAKLVPSEELQERRAAYVKPDQFDIKKKKMLGLTRVKRKNKQLFSAAASCQFDNMDLNFYEEVAQMPPFARKTLVLIGPQGVGRRTLKNRLMNAYPENFAAPLPYTSRRPRPGEETGRAYVFVNKAEMEEDIRSNKYLEYGEFDGNYYGTHLQSVHEVIDQGKMCVLDCGTQALKVLKSAQYTPFIVMIAAPSFDRLREVRGRENQLNSSTTTLSRLSDKDLKKTVEESTRMKKEFAAYIDLCIINDNTDNAFAELVDALQRLSTELQWIPVSWIY